MVQTTCGRSEKPLKKVELESKTIKHEDIDELLDKAKVASKRLKTFKQNEIDYITRHVSLKMKQHTKEIAEAALAYGNLGTVEEKFDFTDFAIDDTYNAIKDKKTVGEIFRDPETDLIHFAEPVGVVAAVLNCTAAGMVEYVKAINCIKTANCIICSPHPRTAVATNYMVDLLAKYAIEAGAPKD